MPAEYFLPNVFTKPILALASLATGLAAGFYWGKMLPTADQRSVASSSGQKLADTSITRKKSGESATQTVAARSQIESLATSLQEVPGLAERGQRFNAGMQSWTRWDGRAAFDYANSLADDTGYLKMEAMAAVAKVLAETDPGFLAGMINELPENASRQALVMALADRWGDTDIDEALAWAEKLPPDRSKSNALTLLRTRLARENPEQLSRVLAEIPAGYVRQNLVATLAAEWGLRDASSTSEWLDTLSDEDKQVAIPLFSGSWAQGQPEQAGTFVANLPAGETQNRAAMSVVAYWASQDPRAAADWAASFSEKDLCELGVREAVNAWSRMDAEGSLAWVKQLPDVEIRDVALKSYTESLAHWAPEKTVALVDFIEDSGQREQSIESVMRSWSEVDPEAAAAWLSRLNVRQGLRNRLQAMLTLPE